GPRVEAGSSRRLGRMSLRYGVVGLLAGEPASGYDLARRFEEALGSIWPAKHPQIYGELTRLADDGMIEIATEGPRRRKVYRVTEAGLADIRQWLATAEVDHTVRLEPLLRSFFFWLAPPDDLQRHLTREAEYYRETARRTRVGTRCAPPMGATTRRPSGCAPSCPVSSRFGRTSQTLLPSPRSSTRPRTRSARSPRWSTMRASPGRSAGSPTRRSPRCGG